MEAKRQKSVLLPLWLANVPYHEGTGVLVSFNLTILEI